MYRIIKDIIKYIYALFASYFIYNLNYTQELIYNYDLGIVSIIVIITISSLFTLYIINEVFDFIIKMLLNGIEYLIEKFIRKNKASKAMWLIKITSAINDFSFIFSNTIYFNLFTDSKLKKFKNLCIKDFRFNFYNILSFCTHYIFLITSLFVLYMRTDVIELILNDVKDFFVSNFESIKNSILETHILTIVVPVIIALFYIGRRNITKNHLQKYSDLVEEEVTLKIQDFCTYFREDLDTIMNNMFYLIKYGDFSENKIYNVARASNMSQLKCSLKDIKNKYKLKSLIDYLINGNDAKYFFEFCTSRKNFFLFFNTVRLILLIQGDYILDFLFNTKSSVYMKLLNSNNYQKEEIVEQVYLSLMLLDSFICFMHEFMKYTKSGFFDRNFRPYINAVKK